MSWIGGFVPGSVTVLPEDNTWSYALTGGGGNFGPQNTGVFTNIPPGAYFLNVVSDDGCTLDSAINVGTTANIPTPTFVLDSLRDVTCFGSNNGGAYINNIESTPTANPPYEVTWTSATGIHFQETVNGVAGGNGDSEVDDLEWWANGLLL